MRNSVASSASMSSLSATFGRSLRGANLWRGDAGASHGCLQTSRRDPRVSGRYSTAEHAGRLSTARTRQSIPQRLSTENAAEGGAACTHTTISPTLKGSCRSARGSSGRHAVFQTPNGAACKLLPGPLRCSQAASTSRFALAPVSCPLATAASPRFILTGSSAAHGPPSGLLAFKRSVCAAPNGFVVSASVSCASSRHLSPASPPGARLLSSLPSIEAHDASNVRSPSTGAHEYKAQLGAQLLEIDQRMLPDEQQFLQKQYLLDTLGPLLRQHIGGQLVPFGSCANGFWVRGSDVDSCLVLSGCEGRLAQRAKLRVVKELVERHRIGEATVVPAQVPIAKVCNAHGKGLIDVSVNNCTALENSIFVETFGAIDDRVRPLGRFIKHWATQRNINNRAEGTLSTYTLMLQLFFFLQQRSPPILPPYTALLLDTDHTKASSPAAPSPCSLSLSSSSPTSDGSSPTGLTPMFSDGEVGGCTPRDADTSRDVAADKEPEIAPRTPAEGLKPLPFCTDIDYIRKNLFPEYGHNKETVGELIHDFFLFYGKRSSKIFSPCDGAIVTVEVYDGSISVCPPLPAFSSSSLGSPFSPSSSSLEALSASYLASAPPSHEIAEVIQPRALPNPPTTGGYRSVAAIFVSSARESEAVKNRRQRDRRHACEERGDIGSSLSMTRRVLMRCPLTRAVVNRFSAAAWKIICDEFQRAEALVETGATLTEICAPAPMKHDHRKKLDRLRRRLSLRALAASRNLLSGPDSIGGSFYGFASGRTNDVGNGQPRSFSAAFRGSHSESLALVESLDKPTSQVSPMLHSVASSSVSAPSSVHLTPVTAPYFSSSSSVLFPDEANCHLCRVAQPSPSVQQSSSSVPVSPSPSSVSPQVHYSYSFSRSPSAQSRSARRRASDDNRRALSSPFLHSFVTASHSPLRFVSRPPLSCFPPPSSAPHARHSPSTSGCGNPRSSQGPMPRQAREN
ncbi:polynucleotide adenylyltransferase [Toxoplasma gondii CAST]|uniref:Polynucleotide adenylyltransferase n=1 Tax=Toxoplasma gondii CAST TaxID=943122 RepID=A0A425HPX4_TOXGO|nr:polynucleotide adenylyltransferase [Toxoplasma gondii CAST]